MPAASERITAAPVPASATQHMVPMRDGIRLATDVYLPSGSGPSEAVLVRLPYDKNSRYVFFEAAAARFTARGYAVVVQDVRGKFRSEGATLPFVTEAADGYDTIEWVVEQPWSNGVVGMFGDSYYGFTQWAAVSSGHPALRAIVPRVTTADLAGAPPWPGPVGEVPWLTAADYLIRNWLDQDRYELDFDWSLRPLSEVVEDAYRRLGKRCAALDFLMLDDGGDSDDPGHPDDETGGVFPDGHPFDARPVAVLHVVAWFDNLAIPSMRDFMTLRAKPGWSELQFLNADSVDHENYVLADAPITDENDHQASEAALDRLLDVYTGPALEFFDVFLKQINDPSSLPRVQWHLGHDGYHDSETWPPPGAEVRRLYLTGLTGATGDGGDLAVAPPAERQEVAWTHDPTDLVPSAVSDSFSFLFDYPDEAATGLRPDVLTFTSPPLDAALDLAGPVDLWATVVSDGPSTDVFAKLLDVSEDGAAHMIVRGEGRLRDPRLPTRVRIELGHTGYRVRPGHRLRLQIASSDFPEFLPNPGTTEDRWRATSPCPTRQVLSTEPTAESYVAITVLRAGARAPSGRSTGPST